MFVNVSLKSTIVIEYPYSCTMIFAMILSNPPNVLLYSTHQSPSQVGLSSQWPADYTSPQIPRPSKGQDPSFDKSTLSPTEQKLINRKKYFQWPHINLLYILLLEKYIHNCSKVRGHLEMSLFLKEQYIFCPLTSHWSEIQCRHCYCCNWLL